MQREMEERQLVREMEEKRLEMKDKLQFDKLAAQLELMWLRFERARLKWKNIEARAEVQSAAFSSQASQENVSGIVDGKYILDNCLRGLRDTLPLRVGNEIRGLFGLTHCLLVKHWMLILDYPARMLGIMASYVRLCCRGMTLPRKDIARGLGTLNGRDKNHQVI